MYNSKILQINEKVPVKVYKNYLFPLLVIFCNNSSSKWINKHFGNVYLMRDEKNYIWYDFLEPSNFYEDYITQSYISLFDICKYDIVKLIEKSISDNKYVTLFLDEYFIKDSFNYRKRHIASEYFVYGFNASLKIFCGFGYNKFNFSTTMQFSYDEMVLAQKSLLESQSDFEELPVWVKWYAFSNIAKRDVSVINNDVSCIVEDIIDYKESNNKRHCLRKEIVHERGTVAVYGLSTQRELINSLYALKENDFLIDYRHIHLLYEHKKIMYSKLEYISKTLSIDMKNLLTEYAQIVHKMEVVRMCYLKGILKQDSNNIYAQLTDNTIINKIINILEKIIIDEREILSCFINKCFLEY